MEVVGESRPVVGQSRPVVGQGRPVVAEHRQGVGPVAVEGRVVGTLVGQSVEVAV